jgi:hypothetical protein
LIDRLIFPHFFGWDEVVEFKGDGEEALVKAPQLAADALISKLTAEHFQQVPYCCEGAADTGEIGDREQGDVGQCEFRHEVPLRGVLASEVKFALQVLLSDFEIEQGHVDIFVSQELHEGRKADAKAQHFCGECVAAMPHAA